MKSVDLEVWTMRCGPPSGSGQSSWRSAIRLRPSCRIMGHEHRLREALSSWGDLELRFTAGPSICVHSVKLALASSVLRALMDDVIDDQLASAKRRKASDGTAAEQMPSLKVGPLSLHECCHYEREAWPRPALIVHATPCRSMASTMTGSRC